MAEHKRDFLKWLYEHEEVREHLFNAVEAEILEKARHHGFELQSGDLEDLAQEYVKGEKVKSAAWTR